MFRSSWFRVLLIVCFALILGYYNLPSSYQSIPGTPDSIKQSKIRLGLDLQGGSQLDYKIDLRKVPEKDQAAIIEGVKNVIERRVNSLGVSEPNIYTSAIGDEQHLIVELAGVKDLNEAKQTVGKTIQLEFKEKRETPEPGLKENIRKISQSVLSNIISGKVSFEVAGQEEMQASPGKVEYTEGNFKFADEIADKNIASAVTKGTLGQVVPRLIDGSDGYTIQDGELVPLDGFFIVKPTEIRDTSTLDAKEKTLQVSHILISYRGADRAAETVTRSKEEAKTEAEALLARLQKGENFETLAKANSDEPAAKESAGKLLGPVYKDSNYAEEFTDAAIALTKVGELSGVTETAFGFHIIRASNFTQYKYSQIFFSTAPDPWQPTELTGEHFLHADVTFDQLLRPIVAIKFDNEGAKLFEKITERNIEKPLAIFVGGNLISSPNVPKKIIGGEAVIEGNFRVEEAQALARDLNTGAIPAPIVLSGQYTIGASLGDQALSQSMKAGVIGIILLVIFLTLYYRLPGFIAVLALSVYTTLLLFLIKSALPLSLALVVSILVFVAIIHTILKSKDDGWEKLVTFVLACFVLFFVTFLLSNAITLTLAGIAGVILSIGMAVDANILIFERTKEELRNGKPLGAAIEAGFDRAWSSIRDSNFSSLITCAILFYFGTSIIQGFAFNLAAGILVSMFSAITITKTLLMAVMHTRLGANLALWGAPKPNTEPKTFHIIEKHKVYFSISGVLIALSLILLTASGLKLGIDFRGGSLLDLTFSKQVSVDEIRAVLSEVNPVTDTAPATSSETPVITEARETVDLTASRIVPAETNQFIIHMGAVDNELHDKILANLQAKFGDVTENRFTTIGPVVGDTLKKRAVIAVFIALAMIVLYIAFAFRKVPKRVSAWKFGATAIVALLHDVLIPVGIFALFQLEVDALFITAILTVLGFSVHDTIVVFDRIRENLKYQERGESFIHVTNKSLSQTMARSINTSLTTLIVLLSLLLIGSPSTFNFVLVLVIGIFVGTYSSVFIASPLLALWQTRTEEK